MDISSKVTLPLGRLVEAARLLGSDTVDFCPKREHTCLTRRGIDPYLPTEDECTNCWVHWFVTGE